MKLTSVILENFRGYRQRTNIEIANLTTFIGKNDVGKSTILEALDLFFNDGKPETGDACALVDKVDKTDKIRISCTFSNLPTEVVLDTDLLRVLFVQLNLFASCYKWLT